MKTQDRRKLRPPQIAEVIFDSCYLVFVVCAGILMIYKSTGMQDILCVYGIMTLVLGGGDSFHLIPRILGHLKGMEHYTKALGVGKWITSITMTMFYLLLYVVWTMQYEKPLWGIPGILLLVLAASRIMLCMSGKNQWTSKDAPLKWAIYRNIPFLIMGVIIIILFVGKTDRFRFMPLAVMLSFLFYIPVVLWSKSHPQVGALMLPKTAAYMWIVCMGLL